MKTKEPSEEGELSRSEQEDGLSLSEDDSTEEILFSSSEDEENKEHSRHRKEKRRLLLRVSGLLSQRARNKRSFSVSNI